MVIEKLNIKISETKDDCNAQILLFKNDENAINLNLKNNHKNEIEEKEYQIKHKETQINKLKLENENLTNLYAQIQNQFIDKNQSEIIRRCRSATIQ